MYAPLPVLGHFLGSPKSVTSQYSYQEPHGFCYFNLPLFRPRPVFGRAITCHACTAPPGRHSGRGSTPPRLGVSEWEMAAPPSGRRPDSGSSVLDSIDSYTNPAHRARSRCLSQVGHGLVTGGLSREFVSRVQNLRLWSNGCARPALDAQAADAPQFAFRLFK